MMYLLMYFPCKKNVNTGMESFFHYNFINNDCILQNTKLVLSLALVGTVIPFNCNCRPEICNIFPLEKL